MTEDHARTTGSCLVLKLEYIKSQIQHHSFPVDASKSWHPGWEQIWFLCGRTRTLTATVDVGGQTAYLIRKLEDGR